MDSAVADTIAVTDDLRQRFAQDEVYLLGQSWGSVLGVLAVQQQPQRSTADIGSCQMVSPRRTDQISYRDTLAWADESGNPSLADHLTAIGPPPYQRMLDDETALTHEQDVYAYDHSGDSEGAGGFSENLSSSCRELTRSPGVPILSTRGAPPCEPRTRSWSSSSAPGTAPRSSSRRTSSPS